MNVTPPFVLRDNYSEEVLKLLKTVTLGSNGARYKHRHIEKRISKLYKPLYLNIERNKSVLGNITLCRREVGWYVRYFAMDSSFQSPVSAKKQSKSKKNTLKNKISSFFEEVFEEENAPPLLYAYIDPRNERSLWMSHNFGFYTAAKIATQTFSRIRPKAKNDVAHSKELTFIRSKVEQLNKNKPLYFDYHTFNTDTPFYVLTKNGKTVALAKTHQAEWVIERLPGRRGNLLVNIIPFVPGVRKVVRPNAHKFTVVDSVWVIENDKNLLEELFEGILEKEQKNTLVWWVDQKEELYKAVKETVNWGLLHKINGVHQVDLVVKYKDKSKQTFESPTYVTGFDFI
jgi:hypothetical protein